MIINDFMQAGHSLVVSDIHLADLDQGHSISPLWKRYKNSEYFIDESFKLFLEKMREQASASIELILNGDIFDFDSVMTFPNNSSISVSWLERLRGLGSEEEKSRFKMKAILDAHPVWIGAIRAFIEAGNRVIFIIGNHDMELHWPAVQQDLINRINLTINKQTFIRFCEWFYISNHDTLIEHSNQYDAYCLCSNPVHPLVKRGSKILVRLPFGNLAGKYMVNGMGLMNPHAMASYIKESICARTSGRSSGCSDLSQGRRVGAALQRILQDQRGRYCPQSTQGGLRPGGSTARGEGPLDDGHRAGCARLCLKD